jgi:type II secretory pathway component PulM
MKKKIACGILLSVMLLSFLSVFAPPTERIEDSEKEFENTTVLNTAFSNNITGSGSEYEVLLH